MPPRLALACLLLLAACSGQKRALLQGFPLPERLRSVCCWQAQQQVSGTYGEQRFSLNAALALEPAGLTLALLGPLGNRLLSIRQGPAGLQVERAGQLPAALPAEFLLALAHSLWLPDGRLAASRWSLVPRGGMRIIRYRHKDLIMLDRPERKLPTVGETLRIQHLQLPLALEIRTLSVQRLPAHGQ